MTTTEILARTALLEDWRKVADQYRQDLSEEIIQDAALDLPGALQPQDVPVFMRGRK